MVRADAVPGSAFTAPRSPARPGLEAAVVDHVLVRVGALDATDTRSFDVRVAGVAALMVAKLHKIAERKDS